MFIKTVIIMTGCLLICGCLYRGEGVFKKAGDTDYKLRLSFLNMFVAAEGGPLHVTGTVLLEDHTTPLRMTTIYLRNNQSIVLSAQTDHNGMYDMSGYISTGPYKIEIASPEYIGTKEIVVESSIQKSYVIYAQRK